MQRIAANVVKSSVPGVQISIAGFPAQGIKPAPPGIKFSLIKYINNK